MVCPACHSNRLQIELSLELPPDGYEDEITLQVVGCGQCGFTALAVYGESRRGALDSEAWRHEGYRVSETDFRAVWQLMAACPRPEDPHCQCAAHQRLGQQSGYRWDGLGKSGVEILRVFNLVGSQ